MTEEQEWASLLAEVFDKLTAKHAAISYKFDKLELSGMVDRNGKKVSTGTVVLTGGLTITTKNLIRNGYENEKTTFLPIFYFTSEAEI